METSLLDNRINPLCEDLKSSGVDLRLKLGRIRSILNAQLIPERKIVEETLVLRISAA